MSFIKVIKSQLLNPQNHRGMRDEVVVNTAALSELIYHFEAMDSQLRYEHHIRNKDSISNNLFLCVEAHYNEFKDGERTLLVVMDSIKKLIKEKRIQQEVTNIDVSQFSHSPRHLK